MATNSKKRTPHLTRSISQTQRLWTRENTSVQREPAQQIFQPAPSLQPTDCLNRIKQIRKSMAFKCIVNKLKQLIVLKKYDKDDVHQEWMKGYGNDEWEIEQAKYLFIKLTKMYFVLEICLFFMYVLMIWFVSVQSVFEVDSESVLLNVWLAFCIIDIFVTLNTSRIEEGREIKNRWKIFKMYLKEEMPFDLICIACLIILTATINKQIIDPIYLILITVLLIKTKNKYQNIRPFIDHNCAKQHITLVTSFLFLITMGHIFALALYLIGTRVNQQLTWLNQFKALHLSRWQTKYIFSLYWAFTTMVTVGYGDITPQNEYEVVVVIVVEIIGTSIFGYMINIIGMTLSELKNRDESLEKEITITDKISRCFAVKDDLTYRLKSFLRNNYKVDSSFSIAEEMKLLEKLNPVLRKELLEETNTKVIKKSIFFLTHFSKMILNKLSVRLTKKIFQPSQPIVQVVGDQALYIIDQGCIDISVIRQNKNGMGKIFSKKVKSIAPSSASSGISINVYGYTELIAGKPINISATSTSFTIAYKLKKRDFLEVISTSINDYESVCELRDHFLNKNIPESVQVSLLTDRRQHYYPNRYVLMRKNNAKTLRQSRHSQHRRNSNKQKSLLFISMSDQSQFHEYLNDHIASFTSQRRSWTTNDGVVAVQQPHITSKIQFMECMKSYSNYMVKCNPDKVIEKYWKHRMQLLERECLVNYRKVRTVAN